MLARHEGQVTLVAGTIPGERVTARIEQVRGGVLFARVEHIDQASPDRRSGDVDPGCGGSLYAHIAYDRQLALKKEIVLDAFQRIGKLRRSSVPSTRMRRRSTATGCVRGCTSRPPHWVLPRGHARSVRPLHQPATARFDPRGDRRCLEGAWRRENRVGRLARPERERRRQRTRHPARPQGRRAGARTLGRAARCRGGERSGHRPWRPPRGRRRRPGGARRR